MTKCTINSNNEITNFWSNDTHAPVEAVDCDRLPDDKIHGIGSPHNQVFLYKLVDGVVTPTEAGISWKAEEYARNRKESYPPMENYLDGVVKGDQAQIDKYIADCLAVKQRHPK